MNGWVVDRTNQRGNEVYERAIAGPWPRELAELFVALRKNLYPDHYYAVREEKNAGTEQSRQKTEEATDEIRRDSPYQEAEGHEVPGQTTQVGQAQETRQNTTTAEDSQGTVEEAEGKYVLATTDGAGHGGHTLFDEKPWITEEVSYMCFHGLVNGREALVYVSNSCPVWVLREIAPEELALKKE